MPCWRFQALYKIREPFTIYHLPVGSGRIWNVTTWRMARQTADGTWQTADGTWQTADGTWQTADGTWQTADGTWQSWWHLTELMHSKYRLICKLGFYRQNYMVIVLKVFKTNFEIVILFKFTKLIPDVSCYIMSTNCRQNFLLTQKNWISKNRFFFRYFQKSFKE